MKRFSEVGNAVWYSVIILIVMFVLGGGYLLIGRVLYPAWLGVQRESVENSKSYNDSLNAVMARYILAYNDMEIKIAEAENQDVVNVYVTQRDAIFSQMCVLKATMRNVPPDSLAFIAKHGGCQ